ncbi:MAG: sulfoxide reductase heme-binding subunit YedZ, partial [Gammaproteobacteria bacterium]
MAMTARQIKPVVFILALLPLASIAAALWLDRLGANPVEAIIRGTGDWTLRLLLITLAVSPVRRLLGWRWAPGLRRMLGLFVWFYASLHLLSYLWLDQFFDWQEIFYDILERPFITVGVLGWLLLTPLALTSTNAAMRRLGTNWKRLHRLVYLIAIL